MELFRQQRPGKWDDVAVQIEKNYHQLSDRKKKY